MSRVYYNKNKINRIKAGALGTLCLATVLTSTGCKKKTVPALEGTSQVVYLDKIDASNNSATFFNVGNFSVKGKSNLKDIQKANSKGVPVGVIINTMAKNKADIYKDAQYAKYLLENSSIEYPVYLDVTDILENEKLRVDEMIMLVSAFCSKLTANGFFVGICGNENDINKLLSNDSDNLLSSYITLFTESDKNEYIISTEIKDVISNKGFNQTSGFTNDDIYYVKRDDRLSDIAFLYGLSVEDLLLYNNLSLNTDISDITKLRIPTRNIPRLKTVKREVKTSDKPLIGIDMSYAQGNNKIDWDKLEKNIDFIILRASYDVVADEYFETFSNQCMQRNIPMGAYCFNECNPYNVATDDDFRKKVENQTQKFIETISGKNLTLPAYLDQEKSYSYTENQVVIMLDTWYDMVSKAGYVPGFYTTKSIYFEFKQKYDNRYGEGTFDSKFDIWTGGDFDYFNDAGYYWDDENNTPLPYDSLVNLLENKKLSQDDFTSLRWSLENPDIVQISEQGVDFGAGNRYDFVDVDITFKDYVNMAVEEDIITPEEAEFLSTMKPKQVSRIWYGFSTWCNSNPIEVGTIFGVTSSVAILALYKLFKNRKRIVQKTKTLKK